MHFTHGIVVVNRPDLLIKAVESVKPLWPYAFILDNSDEGWIGSKFKWPIPVIRPSVPLTVAQTMNYLQRRACEGGFRQWGYQHNDAEAHPGTADKFLERVAGATGKWSAVLTHYDTLSAYNTDAVAAIGSWDTNFPDQNYHVDVDWFRRARLAGYHTIDTDLQITHFEGRSCTMKSDPGRRRIHTVKFEMNNTYYQRKWGGDFGKEIFNEPWGEK